MEFRASTQSAHQKAHVSTCMINLPRRDSSREGGLAAKELRLEDCSIQMSALSSSGCCEIVGEERDGTPLKPED